MSEAFDSAQAKGWSPPEDWRRVLSVDAHAGGEPLRVILEGWPKLEGETILERRRFARASQDDLRSALMLEPRGHADMYGCLLTSPVAPDSDFGVLFLHNDGFSTMCGHGIIAASTVVLETGLVAAVEPETELVIDTPAGVVRARARVERGRVRSVKFRNVPSFVRALDQPVTVPGWGKVRFDLAFGGVFYAFVDAESFGIPIGSEHAGELARAGMAIKRAVADRYAIEHPTDAELGFLYGTIFVGAATESEAHSRHVCVFANGEIDRSPTGTGVSARLAILRARGEIDPEETIEIESIVGSRFSGRIAEETEVAGIASVVPEIGGAAWLTGRHEFWIDPSDPFATGFLLRP